MNEINEEKYKDFSYILSGCRTIIDAYFFADKYINKNPEMKQIILSMINGKRYDSILDFNKIKFMIEQITKHKYSDDINEILNQCDIELNIPKIYDTIQTKTFTRIMNSKIQKTNHIEPATLLKNCPHCNHNYIGNINSTYVVCGYSNSRTGFDYEGCGKDWCFACGKMLCKNWGENQLYNKNNRTHDEYCCKTHSIEHNNSYPNDYCMCIKRT